MILGKRIFCQRNDYITSTISCDCQDRRKLWLEWKSRHPQRIVGGWSMGETAKGRAETVNAIISHVSGRGETVASSLSEGRNHSGSNTPVSFQFFDCRAHLSREIADHSTCDRLFDAVLHSSLRILGLVGVQ
jgi:hypothetical protein